MPTFQKVVGQRDGHDLNLLSIYRNYKCERAVEKLKIFLEKVDLAKLLATVYYFSLETPRLHPVY